MDCKEVCEKIYDYIEHHLIEKEAKHFEEHMKDCTFCQEEYYKIEKLIVKLKNIKDIEPPKELRNNILINIKKEEKKYKILHFKKYSYIAATVAVFIIGAYTLNNTDNSFIENKIYNVKDDKEHIIDSKENMRISKRSIETDEKVDFSTGIENGTAYSSELKENILDDYLYEKNIKKENLIKEFKHDVGLSKDQICKIYFENKSNQNVTLYVQDIDSNKVSQEIVVEKKSKNNFEFFIPDEKSEKDVYTINIKGDNYIDGYLKVEILPK